MNDPIWDTLSGERSCFYDIIKRFNIFNLRDDNIFYFFIQQKLAVQSKLGISCFKSLSRICCTVSSYLEFPLFFMCFKGSF
jgi:hypothetical protein